MAITELHIGQKAPDFSLKNEQGEVVQLSHFEGKQPVVLFFYPGDLTPGCTLQLCAVRDDWQKFEDLGIAVFGINHANAESHQKFIKKYSFPFPLLIDPGKKISMLYGAIRDIFRVQVIRRTVVGIDKQGTIRYQKRGMPKNSEILKAMQKFA
ncbi:MAG TPA: peroxiredoxin [Patescibacteria group bacterium]|nr:peroxiredoxin [Patescibacteria group bacterium]